MTDIQILYDNTAFNRSFACGWGFSCLINGRILFDTGDRGVDLIKNMELLNVDPMKIEAVIISHDHWDHWGGLPAVIEEKPGITVYLPENVSPELTEEIKALGGKFKFNSQLNCLSSGIYISPPLKAKFGLEVIYEQALFIESEERFSIITGCAHPGVLEFAKLAQSVFPGKTPDIIMGGFHLVDMKKKELEKTFESLRKMGFSGIYPCHCSGESASEMTGTVTGSGWSISC